MSQLRLIAGIKPLLLDFGPLLVFLVLMWTVDLKIAIAAGVVLILLDALWRWRTGRSFNKLYILSSSLTIVFGCIDLYSASPFMLKYEDVITSSVLGCVFLWGARGRTSMVQTLAEQQQGAPYDDKDNIRLFFKLFTVIWAGYFFLKAAVYWWIGDIMPMQEALTVRPIVGNVSLGLMLVLSWQGSALFQLGKRVGILPESPDQAPPGEPQAAVVK